MYRSAIFYHNESQKSQAQQLIKALNALEDYKGKIVTTLEPMTKFWVAEDYH